MGVLGGDDDGDDDDGDDDDDDYDDDEQVYPVGVQGGDGQQPEIRPS